MFCYYHFPHFLRVTEISCRALNNIEHITGRLVHTRMNEICGFMLGFFIHTCITYAYIFIFLIEMLNITVNIVDFSDKFLQNQHDAQRVNKLCLAQSLVT